MKKLSAYTSCTLKGKISYVNENKNAIPLFSSFIVSVDIYCIVCMWVCVCSVCAYG